MVKPRVAVYALITTILIISLTVIVTINFHAGTSRNKSESSNNKIKTSIEYFYEKTDKSNIRLLNKDEISHVTFNNNELTIFFQGVYEEENHITYSLEGNNDEAELKIYIQKDKTSDIKTIL